MSRSVMIVLAASLAIIGCAKKPEQVTATYVSPLQYDKYSCRQIAEEAERISIRVSELSGAQQQKRTGDVLATTAAVVIFWPAAFLVGGDDAQTAELARMKGEFETIQKVAIQKKCGLQFKIQQAPPPPKKKKEDDFERFSS